LFYTHEHPIVPMQLPSFLSLLPVRLVLSTLAILCLALLMLDSATFGFSRLLSRYALIANSAVAANEAVNLTPSDPDAHRVRAMILSRLGLFSYAETEQEFATSLRPLDDYLWLELGNIREQLDDNQGALLAYNRAVARAPYYAHPRWQRGNLLLQMGQYDEAFSELRTAARSNRTFVPNLIDLTWALSHKDAGTTARILQINDDYSRIAFARFLAKQGQGVESLAQLNLVAGSISQDARKDILRQLIETHSYKEALEVWKSVAGIDSAQPPFVYDGGFEGPIAIDEIGFGWRIPRELSKIGLSQDLTEKQSGAKSLRVTFDGNSTPGTPLLSQTVLTRPQARYRISFAVFTRNLVTGGLPVITTVDASNGQLLGKSEALPQSTDRWQIMTFEFNTPPMSDAIILNLQRNDCTTSPCPAFGVLWLDSFSIEEMKP
jgi:tetratricopeptide (TPR) repeat protein